MILFGHTATKMFLIRAIVNELPSTAVPRMRVLSMMLIKHICELLRIHFHNLKACQAARTFFSATANCAMLCQWFSLASVKPVACFCVRWTRLDGKFRKFSSCQCPLSLKMFPDGWKLSPPAIFVPHFSELPVLGSAKMWKYFATLPMITSHNE